MKNDKDYSSSDMKVCAIILIVRLKKTWNQFKGERASVKGENTVQIAK